MSTNERLEDYIVTSFQALKLEIPSDDAEYIARLVEEDEVEDEDKKEGIRGMIEGVGSIDVIPSDELDSTIHSVIERWRETEAKRKEEEEARRKEAVDNDPGSDEGSDSEDEKGDEGGKARRKALLDSLTPEERLAAQRRFLLQQYGYVEDTSASMSLDDPAAGIRGETARKREEDKAKDERRLAIEKAIREEGRRKKKKNRQNQEIDLLAPNLNREKVAYKEKMAREAAKMDAQHRKDRDRAALEKQRADQAKAKLDRQKKSQKQERRG